MPSYYSYVWLLSSFDKIAFFLPNYSVNYHYWHLLMIEQWLVFIAISILCYANIQHFVKSRSFAFTMFQTRTLSVFKHYRSSFEAMKVGKVRY